MSECVVRMEMPQGCWCCPFGHYDWIWGDDGREKMVCFCCLDLESEEDGHYLLETELKRPSWCPIICSLPEGHGDLVDWKDVEKELDKSFCSVVDDGPCMGPYMLKRKEYPQALIERPIRVNIIVPAEAESPSPKPTDHVPKPTDPVPIRDVYYVMTECDAKTGTVKYEPRERSET